ncbi:MAG TPA: hypothetical protein VM597_08925 [Gemmataceae bacterium]|jgi:hypothetical protein|nr:hypothetical protein [Gemmataceae bacterium]
MPDCVLRFMEARRLARATVGSLEEEAALARLMRSPDLPPLQRKALAEAYPDFNPTRPGEYFHREAHQRVIRIGAE